MRARDPGKRRNCCHLECHCPEPHSHLSTLTLHWTSALRLEADPAGSAWGLREATASVSAADHGARPATYLHLPRQPSAEAQTACRAAREAPGSAGK